MSEAQRLWHNGGMLVVIGAACGLMTRRLHTTQDVLWAMAVMLTLMGLGFMVASRVLHHTSHTGVMDAVLGLRFSRRSSRQIAPERTGVSWRSAAGKLVVQMIVGMVLASWIFQYGPSPPPGALSTALLTIFLLVSAAAVWGTIIGLWMAMISIYAPSEK